MKLGVRLGHWRSLDQTYIDSHGKTGRRTYADWEIPTEEFKMKALTKGFNGGLLAFRLVFAVVVAELAIVAGTVVGCFEEDFCTDADTQAIKETMQGLATKRFALYAAEKGISSNNKKEEE